MAFSCIAQVVYDPVEFPAVTVCNLNNLRQSQLHLGGEELGEVLEEISQAQEDAAMGKPVERAASEWCFGHDSAL